MLGDGLACHIQTLAKVTERLTVLLVQSIQQLPTASIGQGAKHSVLIHAAYMEPFGSLFICN